MNKEMFLSPPVSSRPAISACTDDERLQWQRALLPLERDPVFAGTWRPQLKHAVINRIGAAFSMMNFELKVRAGSFSAALAAATAEQARKKGSSSRELLFETVPSLITKINTGTVGTTAMLPRDVQRVDNTHSHPVVAADIYRLPTLGQQWLRAGHIPPRSDLVGAVAADTERAGQQASFLSGAADSVMTDSFVGQMLCLSFVSVLGDLDAEGLPLELPAWLAEAPDLVFFDLGSTPYGSHRSELWRMCHTVVQSNGAFPPCYAWVRVCPHDPCQSSLFAIFVNGQFLRPADGARWVCAKALVSMNVFLLTEFIHLCMHKLGQLNAIAAQHSVPVEDPLYALLEPFTMDAIFTEMELTTLLVSAHHETQSLFAFLTDLAEFKSQVTPMVRWLASHTLESPCRARYAWWGVYQGEREDILRQTYCDLLSSSKHTEAYTHALADLCNTRDRSTDMVIHVLKTVSIFHASATFSGAHIGLNGLMGLALGMMQRGATLDPGEWDDWEALLPAFGPDDFTAWWVRYCTTLYATGETDGPYLLDPESYYQPGLTAREKSILRKGFARMRKLGDKVYQGTRGCDFKPTWYYSPDKAALSLTTTTSGTYV